MQALQPRQNSVSSAEAKKQAINTLQALVVHKDEPCTGTQRDVKGAKAFVFRRIPARLRELVRSDHLRTSEKSITKRVPTSQSRALVNANNAYQENAQSVHNRADGSVRKADSSATSSVQPTSLNSSVPPAATSLGESSIVANCQSHSSSERCTGLPGVLSANDVPAHTSNPTAPYVAQEPTGTIAQSLQQQQDNSNAPAAEDQSEQDIHSTTLSVHPADVSAQAKPVNIVTVPHDKTKMYALMDDLYIGFEDAYPLPPHFRTRWTVKRQIQLAVDLRDAICHTKSAHRLQSDDTKFGLELCMAGKSVPNDESVVPTVCLEPTLLIRCKTKTCKSILERSVTQLAYMSNYKGNILVKVGGPEFAGEPSDPYQSEDSAAAYSASDVANPCLTVKVNKFFSTACGLHLSLWSQGYPKTLQANCRLGGLIRVGNEVFGLTTAHSFFLPHQLSSKEANAPEDIDITTSPGKNNSVTDYQLEDSAGGRVQLAIAAFGPAGAFGIPQDEIVSPTPSDADFACIHVSALPKSLRNTYIEPESKEATTLTRNYLDSELTPGPVVVLDSTPSKALLYESTDIFVFGDTIFQTRKVRMLTKEKVPLGLSGSWVVRGTGLCGCVLARYPNDPHVYIQTAESVFRSIKQVTGNGLVQVATAHEMRRLPMDPALPDGNDIGPQKVFTNEPYPIPNYQLLKHAQKMNQTLDDSQQARPQLPNDLSQTKLPAQGETADRSGSDTKSPFAPPPSQPSKLRALIPFAFLRRARMRSTGIGGAGNLASQHSRMTYIAAHSFDFDDEYHPDRFFTGRGGVGNFVRRE